MAGGAAGQERTGEEINMEEVDREEIAKILSEGE